MNSCSRIFRFNRGMNCIYLIKQNSTGQFHLAKVKHVLIFLLDLVVSLRNLYSLIVKSLTKSSSSFNVFCNSGGIVVLPNVFGSEGL
jgi:hypothetical protein